MLRAIEHVGRTATRGIDELGFAAALFGESLYWTVLGRRHGQTVRFSQVVAQMMQIGVDALPIATLLAATIGLMLAMQGIYSLGLFGAESYVHVGIALSVTREFAPLIIGVLIAGRSGSALAARLSAMMINQEVDALRAIGIFPARFLIAPALLGMVVMLPALTIWANIVALSAAGVYVSWTLDITLAAYFADIMSVLAFHDAAHGVFKSAVFAVLIVMVAVVNGALVKGGAEGVGRATTRSVVHGLSAIIVVDLILVAISTS